MEELENSNGQNIPTENDLISPPFPMNEINPLNETTQTEETIIINEGAEDDSALSDSQNIKLNEQKINDIVNSGEEDLTPEGKKEMGIGDISKKSKEKKNKENMIIYSNNKLSKKKSSTSKQRFIQEEKEKNKNDENTDELFKKAIENAPRVYPPIEHDNNLSVKVTEVLYDKFVGKNPQKSKHPDIYSKFKDEAVLQQREWNRTKDDAKKISNMIERQEKYEEIKHDKKIGRQRELKNRIKKECVFIPNGKKDITIQENMRTPSDFYSDQKKFIEKKVKIIDKLAKDRIEGEEKNKKTTMVSKNSEKIANNKNPNETLEQFCKRLAEERLRNKKETLDNKKEETKKMTKKEMQNLTEKLHKEGETFKINREKKEKEIIDKLRDTRSKNNFVLEKSTKVIFDKFVSEYHKIVTELFDNMNKENKAIEENYKNYEINYEEYKKLLNQLGFIKSDLTENENIKNKINSSFNNYLNPKDGKIDTNKFLAFCLAALGIYKGKDEKIIEHNSKITPKLKPEEENDKEKEKEKPENAVNSEIKSSLNNNLLSKRQIRTSTEFINSYLPNLDLDKYGYTEKECNLIKSEFFVFVLGISESWSKNFVKKKQERLDKQEGINKKNNLEETKKLENKIKKEEEIIGSFRRKLFNDELPAQNDKEKEKEFNATTSKKSFRVEDMYEIFQKKKQRELDTLKAKKEEDINKVCTFQPNYNDKNKNKPINKKELDKSFEKLYLEGRNLATKKKQEHALTEVEKECTFKPAIKDYKGDYFENNPLKEDRLFNTQLKKMEKIREEKGYTNKIIKKQMAFNIEPKSNKDNINERIALNRGEKIVNNVQNEFIDYPDFDEQGNQVLIKIEVNLENNKNELLTIQPGEDYIKIVDEFCLKHDINEDKKIRLIRAIRDKIRKNEN